MSARLDSMTLSGPRSPWQRLYTAAHAWRRRWYRIRQAHLPRPVISVGNLHWGGTGKTPLVAALARRLRDDGIHVTILSRGYKSKGSGVRVVSTGEGPLLGPLVAGDEPVLLASELPGVSVLVGPDRFRAGEHALERLSTRPDVFLLEDGFSHLRLHRDVDILTFPERDTFASGKLLPSGRLREPLASSRYADAVVMTGVGAAGRGNELSEALRPFGFRGRAFAAPTVVGKPQIERGEPLPEHTRVVLVTGVARPERVVASVERMPYDVVEILRFSDHHHYPQTSIDRISKALESRGADCVLTTAKDHVKLLGRLDVPLAMLPLRAEPEPAFWDWIEAVLKPLLANQPAEAGTSAG